MRLFFVLSSVFFVAGCSGSRTTCVTGTTQACACSDGRSGAQICSARETFGECVCGEEHDGGTTLAVDGGTTLGRDAGAPARDASSADERDASEVATVDAYVAPPELDYVFVTHDRFHPSEIEGACEAAAEAAGLSGEFHPWRTVGPSSAAERLPSAGPWFLLDGTEAFSNRAQLASTPHVSIDVTERNERLDDEPVWTGTARGGLWGQNCEEWTSDEFGDWGVVGSTGSTENWTEDRTTYCSGTAHVYCFED